MSKKVDERVVEMRFDNQQFESATRQTMSTLDKLKAALKLPTSSKALDGVASAAKSSTSNLSGLGSAVETVNARFSALQVVGMTALSNITSAAMRAGTNLVKSFTLDPVISGFQEYETQLNSVQTILANTSSKGTTMDQVTAALDELNTYADQTIYNFTEMTRNIGTFTAAGVGLETSVSAIKGIANLAAVSGSSSVQASQAMYQLSQALAAGRVSLMDWNSVVNAGMGGEVFQNALKRTATVMGKDVDGLIEKYGSFRESLTQGEWLTTDVLTETLKQFTMAAEEGSDQWKEFKKQLMDTGYTEAQAVEILNMANTATDAATKVKTFTQLMDTLKEAMGSGWAKTWQLIFGDFEEARVFWTEMSDMFSGIINNFSDARNNVIEAAMGGGESRWGEFTETLDKAGVSVESFQKKLGEVYKSGTGGSLDDLIKEYGSLEKAIGSGKISADMISKTFSELAVSTDGAAESTKSLAEWQKVVDDVWRGDYGNIDTGRMEKLAAAGWEYAEVQKLVNMTVDGHRLTLEDLNAAQLVSMGYTKEQAAAIEELAKQASAAGTPLNELINDLIEPKRSGRELFLEGIKNILEAIMKPLGAIADAFGAVFAIDADGLYDLIKGFNEFSKAIIISGTDAANLGKTFKGLFSIVKLISTGIGKTLTFAFKAANALLAPFGTNVLEITGAVGEAIYQFSEWVTSGKSLGELFDSLDDALGKFMTPIINFTNWLADLPVIGDALRSIADAFGSISNLNSGDILGQIPKAVSIVVDSLKEAYNTLRGLTWQDVLNGLSNFGTRVREFFSKVAEDMKEVGPNIIEGLQNGLKDGIDGVVSFLKDLGTKIIEAICAVLGIHSPSTVFFEIGTNIVQGLINGIRYLSGQVTDLIHDIVDDIKYAISGIDWGAVTMVGVTVGSFAVLYQLTDALQGFATAAQNFSKPAASIAGLGDSLKTTVDGFNKFMGFTGSTASKGFKNVAEGIKILAEAIAILAGSIAVLAVMDINSLWGAVRVIGALAAIIGVLAIALSKFAQGGTVLQAIQLNSTLISLGIAFALFAASSKILGTMDYGAIRSAQEMISSFVTIILAMAFIGKVGGDLKGVSKVLSEVGVAFLLLSVAAKIMGTMDAGQMKAAEEMLASFALVVSLLMLVSQVGSKGMKKAGSFLQQIGTTFLLLSVAAKIMGSMSPNELNVAISCITAFGFVVAALMAATRLIGGNDISAIGNTILQVAGAMALLAAVSKIIGGMSIEEMGKAALGLTGLVGIIALLMLVTRLAPEGEMAKVGATLLAMSLSIAILGGIAVLLGQVDPAGLATGMIAMTALVGLLAVLVGVSHFATGDLQGTMFGLAAAIGVMAASVAVLSFIEPDKLFNATAAMTVLLGMLALVTSQMGNIQNATGGMLILAAIVALLGGILYALSGLPVEGLVASAASLSAVLIALASACAILGTIKDVSNEALIAAGVMTAVMAAMAAVLWGMSALDVQNAIPNAIALTILLGALTGVTAALAVIGPKAAAAQAALPSFGIIAAAITAVIGIAGRLNELTGGAVAGVIESGGEVLAALGGAIGGFVGSIIVGIGEGISDALPAIGENLSAFGNAVMPFFNAMSSLDPNIGSTIEALGTGLLALTAGGLLEKLSGIFGDSSLETLSSQLPMLGIALSGFAMSTALVDGEKVGLAAQAFKTVAEAMSSVPNSGGLLGDILGGKDYSSFATGMKDIGGALQSFSKATTDVTVEGLQPKVDALRSVIEAMSNIPNSGGWLGDLIGGKDYSGFATGMKDIGDALSSFSESTTGISDAEHLRQVAEALKVLIEGLSEVPNSGGWLDNLMGGQNYESFGEGLKSLGNAVSDFHTSTAGIEDAGKFTTVVDATRTLIDGLASISNTGGLLGMLLGGQDFTSFSTALGQIGTGMESLAGISNTITDVGTLQTVVSATNTLITGLSSITTTGGLFNMMLSGENDFSSLSTSLSNLGTAVSGFASQTASTEFGNIQSAIDALSKIIEFITSAAEIDTSGIDNFKSAIDSLAETNVSALVETFNSASGDMGSIGTNFVKAIADGFSGSSSSLTDAATTVIGNALTAMGDKSGEFGTMGQTLITEVANGINDYAGTVSDASANAINGAISAARDLVAWNFYNLGCDIAYGLRDGIMDRAGEVASAAANMVSKAIASAKAAADSNSPSKKFYQLGEWCGMGYVNALGDYAPIAAKASADMTNSAINGVSKTISSISDVLNSDMDVTPTIRPVLDLEDVKNGASSINNMLNGTVPMNVLGRVNSISRSMDARIQNGSFNDVVGAIEKLRTGLSELGGTTYQIGDVTYDDGTNVANAVGDLTRAIRLQRRV